LVPGFFVPRKKDGKLFSLPLDQEKKIGILFINGGRRESKPGRIKLTPSVSTIRSTREKSGQSETSGMQISHPDTSQEIRGSALPPEPREKMESES
jgi:hypothetical protein